MAKKVKGLLEGSTNKRSCKCVVCASTLVKGSGYLIPTYGSYVFTCEKHVINFKQSISTQKTYKHGLNWTVTVASKKEAIATLASNGWLASGTKAVLLMNTLNRFKAVDGIGVVSARVVITTPEGSLIVVKYPRIGYKKLRANIIIASKRLLASEIHGKELADTMVFNDFPDFNL